MGAVDIGVPWEFPWSAVDAVAVAAGVAMVPPIACLGVPWNHMPRHEMPGGRLGWYSGNTKYATKTPISVEP